MNNYQIQTEITNETNREIAFNSERKILEADIQDQKRKISRRFFAFLSCSGLIVLIHSLANFFWQYPVQYFFFTILGVFGLIETLWLYYGLRKRQKKLYEWEKLVAETAISKYKI